VVVVIVVGVAVVGPVVVEDKVVEVVGHVDYLDLVDEGIDWGYAD
jgi:hypothetical protein